MVQQFQILISPTFPLPSLFKNPCCVPVLECLSLVMSVSARVERARVQRIASNDRLVKHKARVQRNKDEFKARLRAEERETQHTAPEDCKRQEGLVSVSVLFHCLSSCC